MSLDSAFFESIGQMIAALQRGANPDFLLNESADRSLSTEKSGSQTERGILEFFRARAEMGQGTIQAGDERIDVLMKYYSVNHHPLLLCYGYGWQTMRSMMKADLAEAGRNLSHGRELVDDTSELFRYPSTYLDLLEGELYSRLGAIGNALKLLEKALSEARQHSFTSLEWKSHDSLTQLYLTQSRPARALDHNLTVQRILQHEVGVSADIARARMREMSIRLELGQHDSVMEIARSPELADLPASMRSAVEIILAQLYTKELVEVKFRQHITTSEQLVRELGSTRRLTNVYAIGAESLLAFGHADEARDWASKSFSLATAIGDHYHEAEASKLLYESNKQLGNLKEALEYLEANNRITKKNQDAELQQHLELADLRMELELNRKAAQQKDEEAARMKAELEHKSSQLTEKTRHLVTQSTAMERFREELQGIVRQSAPNDPFARKIRERISELPQFRMDYEEFNAQFLEIYPDFLKRLKARFPKLTRAELRLCPPLMLNLRSQEIAALLSLSERSIETHRHNIRKELGIARDANLSTFLSEI